MNMVHNAKSLIKEIKDKPKHEKMILFASILTELLANEGIKPIIVGGLSVEIYLTHKDIIDFKYMMKQKF